MGLFCQNLRDQNIGLGSAVLLVSALESIVPHKAEGSQPQSGSRGRIFVAITPVPTIPSFITQSPRVGF